MCTLPNLDRRLFRVTFVIPVIILHRQYCRDISNQQIKSDRETDFSFDYDSLELAVDDGHLVAQSTGSHETNHTVPVNSCLNKIHE